jgi:hypothetical protein
MTFPKDAMLEGRPVIILAPLVAYWLVDGAWIKMHPADITQAVLVPPYIKRGGSWNDLSKDRLAL